MSEQNYANVQQQAELMKYISDNMKIPVLGAGGGFAPIGTINFFDATTAPLGWLACDGSVHNISDYPDLATYYASVHGASNFYGGNGTTTFAVPNLQGEFLRGAGTNGHTNQGSGGSVGEHQDGTIIPANRNAGNIFQQNYQSNGKGLNVENYDYAYTATHFLNINGTNGIDNTRVAAYTSRPTNTSFLICVKATVAGDANAHQYSTEEQVVGKWIDGSDIYERTWTNITVPSGAQDETLLLDLTTLNYETPISIEATTTGAGVVPYVNPHDSNYGFGLRFNSPSQSNKGVIYTSGVDRSWYGKITITLRYTKTQS